MKKVLCLVVALLVVVTGLLLHGLATGGEGIERGAASTTATETPTAGRARASGDQAELKRIIRQRPD